LSLEKLTEFVRNFVRERDWEQFHTPKNLVMALAGEVGELTELFQWLTTDESKAVMRDEKKAEAVRDELADVFVYTMRLADVLGIDLDQAVRNKMQKNAAKYPVDRAKGKAVKYTDLK
jgi:dCTP diphosphatase